MKIKEIVDGHLKKSSAHHDALAKCHRSLSKAHGDAAEAHTNQVVAQAHRDIAKCHSDLSKAHEMRQADFEALRESLAAGSGADVFDSHESETRDLQSVRSARGVRSLGCVLTRASVSGRLATGSGQFESESESSGSDHL